MPDIGFYIHHQGSGHFYRALSIAQKLTGYRITFFGSDLKQHHSQIPATIQVIHLDYDYDQNIITDNTSVPDTFHYAPIGIAGLANRAAALVNWFVQYEPCLLVVDVSVEITYLARLCGIRSVMIKLNGNRTDLPHLSAYECAEKLIAPYPEWMDDNTTPQWVKGKTLYSGGFSRLGNPAENAGVIPDEKLIVVLLGSGGTKITLSHLVRMASSCPDKNIVVMGLEVKQQSLPDNLVFHGYVNDPTGMLGQAGIVVGSAGDNVVMEVAQLKKKFICIPEDRPFEEQYHKAAKLAEVGLTIIVPDPGEADWPRLFDLAESLDIDSWNKVIDHEALNKISKEIDKICLRNQ